MAAHAQHRIHDNSREAYHAEQPKLSRRARLVRDWLAKNGKATDRDIATGLGFVDMNAVRPRVTELVDAGIAVEVGSKTCCRTGRRVRVVDLNMTEKMR